MASHVCDTGHACVNMHGTFGHYIKAFHTWGLKNQSVGAARRRRRKGKEKGRKGEEKGRKGKEKERKRKEKERRKEKNKGEEERKRKECSAVRRPRLQRTRNCTTRGRFPPTLVILRLGAV